MQGRRGARARRARAAVLAALLVVVSTSAACSSTDSPGANDETTTRSPGAGSTTSAGSSSTQTTAPATTTTVGWEDAGDGPRSAPPVGGGTALLRAVRVGRHDGYERVVFEFEGASRPGYRIRWVDGPVLADGSGAPVDIDGVAFLEMAFEPASGVDPADGRPTYTGSDHILRYGDAKVINDVVRTGDFEAVLTWVAGATRRVPFRVLSLGSPTRLVVDVQTP